MDAVTAGGRAAFQRIVAAHQTDVVAYCVRFLADPELARDVAQEVFVTPWRERERYVERGKLKFYLLRIARLRCLAIAKKRRFRFALTGRHRRHRDAVHVTAPPADAAAGVAKIERSLRRLAPAVADLMILRHLDGMTLAEIRDITGLRIATIKSRVSRGLAALRKELAHDR